MKTKLLLPNRFKTLGLILLVPSTLLGLAVTFSDFHFEFLNTKVFSVIGDPDPFSARSVVLGLTQDNITNELAAVFFLLSLAFIAFSREKHEDEYIWSLRFQSLLWATYVSYGLLLFGILFIYGTHFLTLMTFNMFTLLIFFIIRFNVLLYRNERSIAYAE